jgi:hypothetical protein
VNSCTLIETSFFGYADRLEDQGSKSRLMLYLKITAFHKTQLSVFCILIRALSTMQELTNNRSELYIPLFTRGLLHVSARQCVLPDDGIALPQHVGAIV